MIKLFVTLATLLLAGCGTMPSASSTSDAVRLGPIPSSIKNFKVVDSGALYRGAVPGEDGVRELKRMGIKSIINLQDWPEPIAGEESQADTLRFSFLHAPINMLLPVKDDRVNKVISYLRVPSHLPAFIHCLHGEDRTGMVVGLYRVFVDGWSPEAAYQEMLENNFHPSYFFLDRYFKNKTGYYP